MKVYKTVSSSILREEYIPIYYTRICILPNICSSGNVTTYSYAGNPIIMVWFVIYESADLLTCVNMFAVVGNLKKTNPFSPPFIFTTFSAYFFDNPLFFVLCKFKKIF